MINEEHAQQLPGRVLLDRDGNRVGEITQVFVNDQTTEPGWVTVTTGWFGASQSFVPLNNLQWSGEHVRAAHDTPTIKAAPRFAAGQPLTPQDEDTLYGYYGLSGTATRLPRQRPPADEPGPLGATTEHVGAAAPGSRGSIHHETPTESVATGPSYLGGATVCQQCGAYIAADMKTVHDAFHGSVSQPPGSYTRHDIQVTEPAAGVTRPPGYYARRDVQVTEPATLT